MAEPQRGSDRDRLLHGPERIDGFLEELARVDGHPPSQISLDPERAEQGLAQLVLTVVELVRDVMERQAVRRIEAGSLTDEEIERLGEAFMALGERMEQLKAIFGLEDEDLDLDLGPLGHVR